MAKGVEVMAQSTFGGFQLHGAQGLWPARDFSTGLNLFQDGFLDRHGSSSKTLVPCLEVLMLGPASEDWMRRALSDRGLQAMFYRFAEAGSRC